MEARSFAGFNARPSPWGYNWTTENITTNDFRAPPPSNSAQNSPASTTSTSSPEPQMLANQYANMPAALLTSMKRDKKPFTYTPGGVNLNEVLNARLQKRIERKKKYSEEHPFQQSPKQVIVMPTYNTPLDMYSMQNAIEALEAQAELVAADKSLSAPTRSATLPRNHTFNSYEKDMDSNRGVTQSKAFKVLQIITDTDEEDLKSGKGKNFQDEMRFTGIRDSKTIPSRFFQTLQKITGTDDDNDEEAEPPTPVATHVEAPRPTIQDRQPSRPGFLPQHKQFPPSQPPPQNHVTSAPQFQPLKAPQQQQQSFSPALRRPAAFMPMKTGGSSPMSHVKPVHPPFLTNGPRKALNPAGGTDF